MLLTRNKRKFADVLSSKNKRIFDILKDAFAKELGDKNVESAFNIFRKVVALGNYKKNGTSVGKAEIALAMFFGDCRLSDTHGDILLDDAAVEVKGSGASFTNRTTLYKDIKDMWYSNVIKLTNENLPLVGLEKPRDVWNNKQLGIKDLDITSIDLNDQLNTVVDNIRKMRTEKTKSAFNVIMFKVLFGALFRSYALGRVAKKKPGETNGGFDKMIILSTKDNVKNASTESELLNTKIVEIVPNKGKNWYEDGLKILDRLYHDGINVQFRDTFGQGGGFVAFERREA